MSLVEKFIQDMSGREITKQDGNFSLLLFSSILLGGFPKYMSRYYDFDFNSFLFLNKGSFGVIFFDAIVYQDITLNAFTKLLQAEDDTIAEVQDFKKYWQQANRLYSQNPPNKIKQLSNEKLDELIKKSFETVASLLTTTVFSEELGEESITKLYQQIKADQSTFSEFLATASKVGFDSFALRIDKVLLKNHQNDPYAIAWMFGDYSRAPQPEKIPALVDKAIADRGEREKLKREYEKIKQELAANKKEIAVFEQGLSGDTKKLFQYVQMAIYTRDARKEPIQKGLTVLSHTAREIFSRRGMLPEDAIYGVYDDFLGNRYQENDYQGEIAKRKNGVTAYFDARGSQLEYGDIEPARQKMLSVMQNADGNEIKQFKGNVAYKGLVKARVSVVLSKDEFDKFVPGSVLVTSMTRPEFLPLMRQAAAVVTDEGGITSHAAIVSRELKIPCIIGTKIATRVLKDGDEVEVDADKGIVRKL